MTQTTNDHTWTSTTTLEHLSRRVQGCRRMVCLTHSKPDGDAIGSTLALARSAVHAGRAASVLYLRPFPRRFESLLAPTVVIQESHRCWSAPELTEADLIAVLDTGSWNQVADARSFLSERADRVVVVDHHAHGNADMSAARYVDPSAASACEIVAELCRLVLRAERYAALPADVAAPLYLGLATDTGWFRHSNTTARTLRMAADLIDAGAPHNALYQLSEQNDEPSRLKLLTRALLSLRLLDRDRVAIMTISRKDIDEIGAMPDETGGLSDLPNTVASVRVVAILVELEPGLTKLSLRSKAPRPGETEVDVNRIAQRFGGGGHVNASGAKLHMPLGRAVDEVIRALTP